MAEFRAAAEVAAGFHTDVIAPLVGDIGYAAGLLGWGSDVLGYDTARSMDHGWGPRVTVLVDADEVDRVRKAVDDGLPDEYDGYPVRFGWDSLTPQHHVTVSTLGDWLTGQLGFNASQPIAVADWLVTPQQQLLGVVAGQVYADDGRLAPVRAALSWYPDQIWHWLMACQWSRIAQEEAFVQRTDEVGDVLGSRVVAARLTRDLMRLALLQSRTYAPYTKWLGTAFARLDDSDGLASALSGAVDAASYADREQALVTAYELVARRHNALGVTDELDPSPRPYFDRPAQVIGADRFVQACLANVTDEAVKRHGLIGSIDQYVDNTDVLSNPQVYRKLAAVYR
ncbi:DUF4037 domain-containing protein [Kribbella solani]|uniref:DUF4037 domain-containing protein n=1 Tax=Kribbella solani TaxID=236067 RepID=A0A841DL56_9ACTN|nr:hypothetical protein [Kribbella solani]